MTTNSPNSGPIRSIKVVVVGDGTVGKTCLLISYTSGKFPTGEYIPTVFENYAESLVCDGVTVNLTLWDTAGQEDYERLRPLSYPGADIFLLCFCVDNIHSYQNMLSKWQPEIKHHCPKTPYILVGTKTDLRYSNLLNNSHIDLTQQQPAQDTTTTSNTTSASNGSGGNVSGDVDGSATGPGSKRYITKAMGKKLAKKINASKYIECSAMTMSGVTEVFQEAVRIVLNPSNTHKHCLIV
ncbi:ras-related protein ced-10-like [Oppia nitens]|uniref:ras-related protein ced-10-like n=1 Tax=Oppia nitens TaxID=1686743 RepID=UPI0023DB105D|nr:ras-related protein ced-10-like [Oppia nitens]